MEKEWDIFGEIGKEKLNELIAKLENEWKIWGKFEDPIPMRFVGFEKNPGVGQVRKGLNFDDKRK